MIFFLLATALASTPVEDPETTEFSHRGGPSVGLGAGLGQSTGLPILGLDLGWQAATSGTSFVGRVATGWGAAWTYEELPSGRSRLSGLALSGPLVVRHEAGFTHVVALPAQAMDVRLGLEAGGELVVGGPAAMGSESAGWTPKGIAIAELVRSARSVSVVGLRMGGGATPVAACDPELSLQCIQWRAGFVGGIYASIWANRKVLVEVELGRTAWLTVGYRF